MPGSPVPVEFPFISVVMPVYNRGRYLAATIDSILAQTYSPFELIPVVDEGSKDDSADIVRDYAARDARVRPLFLSHGSQWRARNAGVALARGEYIAHMDDDDIALPQRLSAQMAWMRRTGVDICGGCVKKFGAEDGILWFPETHDAIVHELLFRIALFLPTALLRTELARAHPYDEKLVYSDYAWLTQIVAPGKLASPVRLGNIPQIVLQCRCHDAQIHILQEAAFAEEESRYRQPYFHNLFPDATADDCAALRRVAENGSFYSLAELERAGIWLLRLAKTPDNFLRRQMADRWRAACLKAAPFGLPAYYLYRKYWQKFEVPPVPGEWKLRLACALHIKPTSHMATMYRQIKHATRQSVKAT